MQVCAKNPVWLGTDIRIYHQTSLAKTLNKTKRFDNYTVVIVSGEYKTKDKLALSTLKKAGKRYEIKTGVTANDIHE